MKTEKTNSFEEQTERYLNGEMSAQEFSEFEKLLEENPDLNEQVELERQLMLAGEFRDRPETKEEIDKVKKIMERVKKKHRDKNPPPPDSGKS